VQAGIKAQSAFAGLWQEKGNLIWWQTGISAVAGNLVLQNGEKPNSVWIQRLSSLMKCQQIPVGWLLWSDQNADTVKPIIVNEGYKYAENISLLCFKAEDLNWNKQRERFHQNDKYQVKIRSVDMMMEGIFSDFLIACHGIPKPLAAVIAKAYILKETSSLPQLALNCRPIFCSWIIFKARQPVASITACLLADRCQLIGGLMWLGTLPKWRRMGFAKQLILQACNWLISNGADLVYVQSSEAANRLYASLGFELDGELELWHWWP